MINGKPGTGKEVFARAIHRTSPRARGQLVMVDCSAVSPGLIGSGLFGHECGSLPGAFDRTLGRDGKSAVEGHGESVRVELGGSRTINKKNRIVTHQRVQPIYNT